MANKCKMSGICCRLFYINISKDEYLSGKFETQFKKFGIIKDWSLAKSSGANFLKRAKDGSCVYLINNKCSIHNTRPKVCHGFFCTSKAKKYEEMVEEVNEERALIKKYDAGEFGHYSNLFHQTAPIILLQ